MKKILIIGELFEDQFIYGECNRLCSEAPVPIFQPIKYNTNLGGAGNVYNNCINILPDSTVKLIHQKTKIIKTRFIDQKSNHIFLRVDQEPTIDKFDLLEDIIKDSDIVIVSDYDKGFLSDIDLYNIGTYSKLSILDSKRRLSKKIIDSYSFVKLNEFESKHNIYSDNIITTLADKGCIFKGKEYHVKPQQTIDVSGAGDTFTSAFIIKYHETNDIDTSINYANELAGIVVSKKGVAVPYDQ